MEAPALLKRAASILASFLIVAAYLTLLTPVNTSAEPDSLVTRCAELVAHGQYNEGYQVCWQTIRALSAVEASVMGGTLYLDNNQRANLWYNHVRTQEALGLAEYHLGQFKAAAATLRGALATAEAFTTLAPNPAHNRDIIALQSSLSIIITHLRSEQARADRMLSGARNATHNGADKSSAPQPQATRLEANAETACNHSARVIALKTPPYPDSARDSADPPNVTVRVEVRLDAQGNVIGATMLQPSGNAEIDSAALQAARASTYLPGMSHCTAVPGAYIVRYDFSPD